jgi:hypothetical protein
VIPYVFDICCALMIGGIHLENTSSAKPIDYEVSEEISLRNDSPSPD